MSGSSGGPVATRTMRWRYEPTLDRVAFKVYEDGADRTDAVLLMSGRDLVALAEAHPHPILRTLSRMIEAQMPVARETEADPALLAVLGLE